MPRSKRRPTQWVGIIPIAIGLMVLSAGMTQGQRVPAPPPIVRPPIVAPPPVIKPPTFQPPTFQPPPVFKPPVVVPPPIITPPTIKTPVIVTGWHCSRCNAKLGEGPFRPNLATCPNCSAQLEGGFVSRPMNPAPPIVAPALHPPSAPADRVAAPNAAPTDRAGSFNWWMMAVGVVILLVFGAAAVAIIGYALLSQVSADAPIKKRTRR